MKATRKEKETGIRRGTVMIICSRLHIMQAGNTSMSMEVSVILCRC